MQEKIRVAVLSNNQNLYAWQHLVLQDLGSSDYADLILNIAIRDKVSSKPTLTWKIFSRLDHFLFRPRPNALAIKNTTSLFKNIIEYENDNTINSENLKKYKFDVIINFSDNIPPKDLISSCIYGVWDLVHTNPTNKKKGPPGVWELILGLPEIGASLRTITNGMKHPIILDQTLACTDWIGYSRNVNIIYWQAYPLINRNLKRLYENRDLGLFKNIVSMDFANDIALSFTYPSAGILIWHSVKTLLKKIVQLINNIAYFNQWILLYSNSANTSLYNLSQYTRILPPKDRFWADPFLIKKNGKYYLFIEELIYKDKLGHLAVMEIDEKGNFTTPKTILKKEYHLSYPFLYEDNGNLYMIPETGGNKDIQLYKCTNFPYEWQLEKVLMKDVTAVDTTIYKKDGLYWMFTNLKVHKGMSSNIELFLFYSKELASDQWVPHPLNPIVTDVRKSRPAGNLFKDGDNLMRPSQNCSHHYGYGLNINKIERLDESNFHEEILHSMDPNWKKDVLCTHTFNSCDKIYIGDAKIKRSRFF